MKAYRTILVFFALFFCGSSISYGQQLMADSCGVDVNPLLNKYEIQFIDSLIFHPYSTKRATVDPKNGIEFESKRIAFYSCTINSNTKGNGVITKQQFFNLIKPTPTGHAGVGLIKFTEAEINNSGGFDAVIIIDCLSFNKTDREKLMSKILESGK